MINTCPLCAAPLKFALAAPDRRFGGDSAHEVWRCNDCGLGLTKTPSGSLSPPTVYPPEYPPHRQISRPVTGWRARLAATILQTLGYPQPTALPLPSLLARPLAAVRTWTWQPPPPLAEGPGRLLDVGCGSGAYGASLIRLGWQVDGIEPDEIAAARAGAAGLNVQTAAILDANLPPAAYDVITLWHVLEHLADPVAALRHLRPALKPGALLIVEVPNFASLGARLTGSYWFHLDLPRHRTHFTPAALTRAMTLAGFSNQSLSHIPNPHGLAGAIAYRRGQSYRRNPLNQALGWAFGIASAALRGADVIRVTAVNR